MVVCVSNARPFHFWKGHPSLLIGGDPSRFERNICWQVWKMWFWKASSLRPHYVVAQQNLGIKTCSDFFSVIRGHLTQGTLFCMLFTRHFRRRNRHPTLPESGPCSVPLHVGPYFGKMSGPWVLPYTKTLAFLCPSFHLANLPCYPE